MNNMKINSVKLINSGSKGIEVKYALPNNKDREFIDDTITHKRKAPIHSELEETFSWLRGHLLDICGFDKATREKDILDSEMVSVTYNDNGFVLVGKKTILDGEKTINLVTPLIGDPSEYAEFGKVISILDGIYEETKAYMSGAKVFSDEQLVLKFSSKIDGFDEESFKAMSKDEQRDICTKLLEDLGHLVIHKTEMTEEEEEKSFTTTSGMEKEYTASGKEIVAEDDDFELEPVITPESTVEKTPAVELVKEEKGFSIVMTNAPVKESTAKRKVKAA